MDIAANNALLTAAAYTIPAGYTELQYVTIPTASGNYLNIVETGISWVNIEKIHVIYSCSDDNKNFYMFCAYQTTHTQTTPTIKFNDKSNKSGTNVTLSDWEFTDGDTYTRDGTKHEYSVSTASTRDYPLGFGGAWNLIAASRTANWYLVELYGSDGNLLGQFVPVRRDSDSVAGFYDTVSETFFSKPVSTYEDWIAGPSASTTIYNVATCDYHTISPASGEHQVAAGTSVAFSLTDVVDIGSGTMRYFDFLGHRAAFASADVTNSGATTATYNTTSFSHTPDNDDILTWNFTGEESCLVINAPTGGSITVTPSGGTSEVITGSAVRWYTSGTSVTLVPTATSGYAFANWGDTTDTTATKTVAVSGQTVATAVFYPVPTT